MFGEVMFKFQPSSSSHPLHLPAPPPPPPVLSVPLFLSSSANKLCMLSPIHGVLHCCTICSKLLLALSLSLFPISHPLSFSLLICLSHTLTCSVTNSTQPLSIQPYATSVSIGRTSSSFPEFLAAQLHPGGFAPVLCQLP